MAGGDGGEEYSKQDLGKGRKEAQWRSKGQGAWSTAGRPESLQRKGQGAGPDPGRSADCTQERRV